MTGQSESDVIACISLATGVFSASLVPFFLLVEAEHLVPRAVRESDLLAKAVEVTAREWKRAGGLARDALNLVRLALVNALLVIALHLDASHTTNGATR